MRLLYWTQQFWPYVGGMEVRGAQYLRRMIGRGHDVQVVTSHANLDLPDEDDFDGIPIHRFPFYKAIQHRDVDAIVDIRRRLTRVKRSLRPDTVHVVYTDPSVFFHLQTDAAHPSPYLVEVVNPMHDQHGGADTLTGRLLRGAAWVVANSQATREQVLALEPAVEPRCLVVYPALEMPTLDLAPLSVQPPRLLCLGRVVKEKGFDLAIHAMPEILARYPQARLTIAGDGSARAGLSALIKELELERSIDLIGWVSPENVPRVMNEASVVIVPSRWAEPFAQVGLQAAQMCRPVVATRVGGLPENVLDGQTGLIVEPEDPAAIAAAVCELLTDPDRADMMGRAGRRRAIADFALDPYTDTLEQLHLQQIGDETHDRIGNTAAGQ